MKVIGGEKGLLTSFGDRFFFEGSIFGFFSKRIPVSMGLDGMAIGKVLGKIADSTTDTFGIFFFYGDVEGRWRRVDETFERLLNSLLIVGYYEIIQI